MVTAEPINIYNLIIYSITFIYLLIASISDLKTREVADWLNYGAAASGIAVNLLFSAIIFDISYAVKSLIGFGILFVAAYILFYTGQWGGGDSKSIIALGALLGPVAINKSPLLFYFFINLLIVGALYALIWSISLAVINRKRVYSEFKKNFSNKKIFYFKIIIIILILISIGIQLLNANNLFKIISLFISLSAASFIYVWAFAVAVEKACLHKSVEPDVLTEGDWITKEIYVDGKYICGPKDLGISKNQIIILKKIYSEGKIKNVAMKIGIPFIPSFFIAFLATIIFGNFLAGLVG